MGDELLWLVARHVPQWLQVLRRPVHVAPGCYWRYGVRVCDIAAQLIAEIIGDRYLVTEDLTARDADLQRLLAKAKTHS